MKIMNAPLFLRLLRLFFFASKCDFLPLFRFLIFKIKRLEEKSFAVDYFSFIKPGGELFQLSVKLSIFFSIGFSANMSGKKNLIRANLSASNGKFWIQKFAKLCLEVLNLLDVELEGKCFWR